MLDFVLEKSLFQQGYRTVAALDEAGRGPLAGPVVAACVIFRVDFNICPELEQVKDSKKLSAKKRLELCRIIKEKFLAIGIGLCDNKTIDKINILQASFLAMKKALGAAKLKPDLVILDGGFSIPNFSLKQQAIVRGDEQIFSIAAASIVAKVTRDKMMQELDQKYPQYGFAQHKGYGTKLHLERLKQYGPCPIHRLSFNRVI